MHIFTSEYNLINLDNFHQETKQINQPKNCFILQQSCQVRMQYFEETTIKWQTAAAGWAV